jgi:alpha-amylase
MKKAFKRFTMLALLFTLVLCSFSVPVHAAEPQTKINQDDLIYFIMTDRFNDGDLSNDQGTNKGDPGAYHGGDFQGIIDKLDYIKGLGFTTIWISPVVKNQLRGYHGYWAEDFYQTNEHFGSMDKLKELVDKAHSRGMKVIIDLVVNHTGQLNPMVDNPEYPNWFHERRTLNDYNNQEEVENGWLSNLPDFNTENPEVRKYLIDMAKWWIGQTKADGYRLDTVRHVPKDFWMDFTKEIKKDYPDFYLIGEVFNGDINYVGNYMNTGIDGMADFPMYYVLNDVFKRYNPATRLADAIKSSSSYKNRNLMGTFIDNHDVPRFVNQINNNPEDRLKEALTFMMTYTGIPVMYYGTEIGMNGGADPDNRKDMDWSAKSPITDYVKKLVEIRKSNKALIQGNINVLAAEKNFISYSRKYEDNTVIVAMNTYSREIEAEFEIPASDRGSETRLTDLLSSKDVKIKDGKVTLKMAPSQAFIFTYKEGGSGISNTILIIGAGAFAAAAVFAVVLWIRKKKK